MGEPAGSIIHEINQPLAAIIANAEACLRWLNRDQPTSRRLGRDQPTGTRRSWAADVVKGLRALARKSGF